MVTLHQFENSPFCDKIRRILHVKECRYELVDMSMGQMLRGAIKNKNSLGRRPVLDIDGKQFYDSTTIAYELEKRYPNPPLIPKDREQKALVHILEDWADERLYFYEMHLRVALTRNVDRIADSLMHKDSRLVQRVVPKAVPQALQSVARSQGIGRISVSSLQEDISRHVESLDGMLVQGNWLVGKSITLADIAVQCQLSCIYSSELGKHIIDRYPRLTDWMQRVDISTAADSV